MTSPQRRAGALSGGRLFAGALTLVLLLSALWWLPKWEMGRHDELTLKERIELEDKFRATLAQIFAGAFVLGGLYFSWRTLVQNAEAQVTDRYYKAVEQLGKAGDENMAIRIGGIYALERIARDSPRDHWTVMEVLCAYVRMHAPAVDCDKVPAERAIDAKVLKMGGLQVRPGPPPADIQTILTVLGRRDVSHESPQNRLDLRATDLRGARLGGANLQRAQLDDAHLEYAQLQGARLDRASLAKTHFEVADLSGASLQRAYLLDVYLEGADLSDVSFRGADLTYAHLQRARLVSMDVQGASLAGANLTDADLGGWLHVTAEQVAEAVVQLDPEDKQLTALEDLDEGLDVIVSRLTASTP